MGKASWLYYVPYQHDIHQAFIDLRRRLLAQEWYGAFFSIDDAGNLYIAAHQQQAWEISREAYEPFQDPTNHAYLAQYGLNYQPHVADIQSFLGQGTGSINEVLMFFSQHPSSWQTLTSWIILFLYQAPFNDPTVIWPLATEQILRFFGTLTPTKELARSLGNRLWDLPLCWYTVLYEGNIPSEILFVGASGD